MNTRVLLSSVVATFLIVSCSSEFDHSYVISSEKNVSQAVEPVNFDGQFEANQLNDCLLNKISATLTTRSSGENIKVYPDYYGGSFIEKNGTLRLLIREDLMSSAIRDIETLNLDGQIRFVPCSYSYNELSSIMEQLDALFITKSTLPIRKNLSAYCIDDENNRVLIYLRRCNDADIRLFRDMFNHPALEFKQLDRIENESSFNVYPGAKAYVHTTNDLYGSFAFRAREKSGQRRVGVVTAGHVTDVGDFCYINDETSNRKTFGECVAASKAVSKADAAFIVPVAGNTITLSNLINDNPSSVLSTVVSNPGVGTYVNMWGASTGNSGGYIQSTTVKVLDDNDNVRFTDMTSANYTSSGGDSGGIIYTYLSSRKVRYTVGIHQGSVPGKNTAVFTKASNALSILGLERY